VGESLISCIVTSRDSAHVREQSKKHYVRFGTDSILKARAKPYVNAEILLESIRSVFLSNLKELGSLEEFGGEDAVFLMDNCPGHVSQ
jgi:methyl coenzyme M reductase gamma subunit